MSGETLAFVDTNVLVYAYDAGEPERQAIAERLVTQLIDEDRILLSTQVLQEFYVTMTRKIAKPWTPDDALALLDDFAVWPLVDTGYALVREAVLLSRDATISFWDALIVVAARRGGAVRLYTEDLNHGQRILGVEVFNPFLSPLA